MTRELLLLRHAKSSWGDAARADFDRPLSKRGRHDAPRMGHWLHQQRLQPDYVVSSPARRARQTALRVCPELGLDPATIHWDSTLYDASVEALLAVLGGCPATARRVLLIGHNPGLEQLLLWLCPQTTIPSDGKLLPTGAVARIGLAAAWPALDPGGGHLLHLQRPHDLHA